MKSREEVISDYYDKYFGSLCNSGLQGKGSEKFHRLVESFWLNTRPDHVLEVGAGIGEHFQYVNLDGTNRKGTYTALDIRDSSQKKLTLAGGNMNVTWKVGSVEKMPFSDGEFDRVVSTCLFHHLDDPLKAFREVRRVTRAGGEISIGFPTDPGMANQLLKNLYTYRKAKNLGIENPAFVYALEHRNQIAGLLSILKQVFSEDIVKLHYWPTRLKSWNLNLAVIAHISRTNVGA